MRERTNTSQYSLLPEKHYVFTVDGAPEKRPTKNGKGSFRIWKFSYRDHGNTMEFATVILPSQSKELLLAVGGVEEGDYVDWDDEKVDGKVISCDLVHELDNNGKMRERLTNIKPFSPGSDAIGPTDPPSVW